MKTLLISLVLAASSFAYAGYSDNQVCTPGARADFGSGIHECDPTGWYWIRITGKPLTCREGTVSYLPVYGKYQGDDQVHARAVCRSGKFIFDNPEYNYRPTRGLARCQEGHRTYLPVYGSWQGDDQVYEAATCRGGKYVFDNPEHNYRPTRGLNRCQEGRIWTNGERNEGTLETYICKNGRAVRIPN